MEEISPLFNLTIYIDNVYCDSDERASCARSIIVSYNQQDIILRNNRFMGGANLEALKGNVTLTLPFIDKDVRVISSSLNLFLEIPQLKVNVIFGITGFSINLPFQHFGNNTQGHCGTCNNNQADDCMIPGGTLINDCAVMADYWPTSVVNNKICTPPAALPTVGGDIKPTPRPCQAHPDCNLLKSKLFEACHSHVSPKNFFLACQLDSCNMSNPAVVCASLQSYASACSQVGVCIHWRNYTNNCDIKCPGDQIFLPCGPFEPPTCRDGPTQNTIAVSTEGCFCRQNTKLFNKESGVCVPQHCGCMDPSGKPREFDEHFEYNCEDCVCDKASTSVICKPKKCPDVKPENCTEPGFMLVNVTDPSDPCCFKQVCRIRNCDVSLCPPLNKKCAVGYSPILEVPHGSICPEIRCEPKSVCVYNNTEYEPGAKIPEKPCVECYCKMDIDPQTELYIVNCSSKVCPDDPCFEGFEYVEKEGECCGTCKPISCIYHAEDNTTHILKDGDVNKYICETVSCNEINGSFVIEKTKTECPYLSTHVCEPGFKYMKKEGECCEKCEPVACIYDAPDNTRHVLKDREDYNYKCETVTCRQTNGSFVIEKTNTECHYLSSDDCEPGFEYVKKDGECCGACRQVACIYDASDHTGHVLKVGEVSKYTCENVTCHEMNGSFVTEKTKTECPYLSSNDCGPVSEYVKKDGECCGICRQVACIYDAPDKTRHVLKEGEVSSYTCENVTCHEMNGSFVIEKTRIVCPYLSTHDCGPGFEYMKKEGECCEKCETVACIYDAPDNTRHVLKDGEESKYKCETVACRQTNGSFVIEKTNTECHYLSSVDCESGFEYVKKDGECCGTCRQVACIYDGPDNTRHVLKDGEVDKSTCETVSCHEINGSFVIEKNKTECQQSSLFDCGPGFEYVEKDGECCGTCTQVACIYDAPDNTRHVLKDGKEYHFKCMNVTCLNRNGMFMTMESYKRCPYFNSDGCVPGTEQLDKDGCCEICETNNCVLEKNVTRLHVNDCTSIEDVEVTSCTGHCDTKSMYLMENNLMMHSCSCCLEERFRNQQVKLKCANDTEIIHDYVYIESCRCTPTMCEDGKTSR